MPEDGWDPHEYVKQLTNPTLIGWCERVRVRGMNLCASCDYRRGCREGAEALRRWGPEALRR